MGARYGAKENKFDVLFYGREK
jgi:hypothetical protein